MLIEPHIFIILVIAIIVTSCSVTFLVLHQMAQPKYPFMDPMFIRKRYNIKVYRSIKTKWVTEEIIRNWTTDTFNIWLQHYNEWTEEVLANSIKDTVLTFCDHDRIIVPVESKNSTTGEQEITAGSCHGVAWPTVKAISIATMTHPRRIVDKKEIRRLFIHELSHIILHGMQPNTSQSKHHEIFRKIHIR